MKIVSPNRNLAIQLILAYINSMKLRLCIFTAFYPPHIGGVERYVSELSLALAAMGHEILIVTSNMENSPDEEIHKNIVILRLPAIGFLGGRMPIPKCSSKTIKLIKKIRKFDADCYIINMRFYPHSILGMILSKLHKKKSVLIEHVTGHFSVNNIILDKIGHLYEHFITRIMKAAIGEFYGVSEACGNWLGHFGIGSSGIVYNGIIPDFKAKGRYNPRGEYGLDADCMIISAGGRLLPEKGFIYLTDAFEIISKEYKAVHLFIAGGGPLQNDLKSRYGDGKSNIHIIGEIGHDSMMDLLSASDIVVIPSYYPEGLPTFILEAGISNCAVIATPMGGTREIISSDEYGVIIRPKSEPDIIDAIGMLIENSEYRAKIAANLKEKVVSEFNWKKIAADFAAKVSELSGRQDVKS